MIHDAKDGATNIGLHSSLCAHLAPFFVLFNASTGYAKSTTGCRCVLDTFVYASAVSASNLL
jgi:hypothetical protein